MGEKSLGDHNSSNSVGWFFGCVSAVHINPIIHHRGSMWIFILCDHVPPAPCAAANIPLDDLCTECLGYGINWCVEFSLYSIQLISSQPDESYGLHGRLTKFSDPTIRDDTTLSGPSCKPYLSEMSACRHY